MAFHGKQYRGATRDLRALKRQEAEARQDAYTSAALAAALHEVSEAAFASADALGKMSSGLRKEATA